MSRKILYPKGRLIKEIIVELKFSRSFFEINYIWIYKLEIPPLIN